MDATAPLRNKIIDAVKSAIPEGTPLGKSIKDADAKEKEELLKAQAATKAPTDEQTQPTRDVAATQPQTFVRPVSAPATPIANAVAQGPAQAFDFNADLPSDLKGGLQEQRQAYQQEAEIYKQQAADIAKTEAQFAQESEREAQLQKQAEDLQAQINKDVDERSRMRVEPKNFFAGKNTWQKVLGGLGLFLSSFSKEGAARFAEAVNNDIEMDIRAQESAINSKDKTIAEKNTLYKQYLDQYKDAKAARLLTRADAYNMIKLKAEAALGMTKSQAAAGAARQAMGLAEQESKKDLAAAAAQLLKIRQDQATKNSGKMISALGFEGQAPTEKEAMEFRSLAGDTQEVLGLTAELKNFAKKGSKLSLEDRGRAETVAKMAQAALRLPIIGPGSVQEGERKILEEIAGNPLAVTKLSSVQIAKLVQLETTLRQKLRNKAGILGLQEAGLKKQGAM